MNTQNNLIEKVKSDEFNAKLIDIYVDGSLIEHQRNRYTDALNKHIELYGQKDVEVYSAPGRTEICGNHTDHQHGKVLAASVNLDAIAIANPTKEDKITLYSEGYGKIEADITELEPDPELYGTSEALIKGVCAGLKERGYKIGGFEAYCTSEVADGAGISSSAAFEVLVGTILSGLYNDMEIDAVTIAICGKYAEGEFFGKPSGLMDQMACSVGGIINIDFEDETKPIVKKIDFDFGNCGYGLCITDTQSSHANLTDQYASIPQEMKSVAHALGKHFLREVDIDEFTKNFVEVRTKVGDRAILRALHFFMEEQLVDNAVKALEENNIDDFLAMIHNSGISSSKNLQNIYIAGAVEDQCMNVAITTSQFIHKYDGVSRVHGGGFAGTIQAFVKLSIIDDYINQMENVYHLGKTHNLRIRKYGGIKVL